jgi:hypothetical protein
MCQRKNVQGKYQDQTARTVWTYCTNSLTMVTTPVYVWNIPTAQELTISDVTLNPTEIKLCILNYFNLEFIVTHQKVIL